MLVSHQTRDNVTGIIGSLILGFVVSLTSGLFQVQAGVRDFIGNDFTPDKFGFPFPWREDVVVLIGCSQFDCVYSGFGVFHWNLLLYDLAFYSAVAYTAVFLYRKLVG